MVVVERPQVVDADPRHVVGPAQDRVAIRMPQVGDGLVGLVEPGLGRFQLAGSLLADDLALGLDLAGVEPGPASSGRPRPGGPAPSGPEGNANQ